MSISIVHSLPEEEWHRFVEDHPAGNIFHTPEMFQVFSLTKGHRPTLWAAVNRRNSPLALFLPVQITLFDGLLRRFTTRAVAYGSVLCVPGPEGMEALSVLMQAYKRETQSGILYTELRNLSDLSELQPVLNDNGFVYEDHLNYLVYLNRSPETILQGIGKKTRKNITYALRQGKVLIEELYQPERLRFFYGLLQKTYTYAQVPLADWSLFKILLERLYPKDMVKFRVAKVGEEYAAGAVDLIHKDRIYWWYGGTDRTYSKYIPNELLLWHILKWGAENGYKIYDFGGAGKPDEEYGVRDFKAKFGGQLVCFGRNICVHSPLLLRLSKLGYKIYRRLL